MATNVLEIEDLSSTDNLVTTDTARDMRFPQEEWRNAISYFLDRVWTDDVRANTSGFRHVLHLSGFYIARWAWGRYEVMVNRRPRESLILPVYDCGTSIEVSADNSDAVETGLARFSKNNRLKMLIIIGKDEDRLYLWKTSERTQLKIAFWNGKCKRFE